MKPLDIVALVYIVIFFLAVIVIIAKISGIDSEIRWFFKYRLRGEIQKLMKLIGYQYSWFNKTQFMILLAIVIVALSVWGHLLITWNQHEMTLKERVITRVEYKDKEKIVNKCEQKDMMDSARNACNNGEVKSFEIDQKGNPKVACK